jgi:hypothetical protein
MEEATTTTTTEASEAVCKFYLSGTCRFGSECHNSHPVAEMAARAEVGSPSTGAKNKKSKKGKKAKEVEVEASSTAGNKRGMKTAMDVIRFVFIFFLNIKNKMISYLHGNTFK